jgi:hypothetical protein
LEVTRLAGSRWAQIKDRQYGPQEIELEDEIQNTDQEQGQKLKAGRKHIKADMHDWRVERIISCILRGVREPSPVSLGISAAPPELLGASWMPKSNQDDATARCTIPERINEIVENSRWIDAETARKV